MSFSFYVRLIRKHDGTAKRNQMRQFACQDIVDLETYDLRTCGVASAEIMLKNQMTILGTCKSWRVLQYKF